MIKSKKPLQWVLMLITIFPGPNGGENISYSIQKEYVTFAECQQEGKKHLSVIDNMPGAENSFACVPREALAEAKNNKKK